jgi:hypothetical protein
MMQTSTTETPRLCASCGFGVQEPVLRDGYALHPDPCLRSYLENGPAFTPERLRDRLLTLLYDPEHF